MVELPDHLQHFEKVAIAGVTAQFSQLLDDNLSALYLFGSKARGDFHADSDIDLLVVLRQLDSRSRWLVRATAADCSLHHDVLFNTHIYDKERWDAVVQNQDTLWREVQRDGIPLLDLLVQPSK